MRASGASRAAMRPARPHHSGYSQHSTAQPRLSSASRLLTRLAVFVALASLLVMANLSAPIALAAPLHSASHTSGNGPVMAWGGNMIYPGQNNGNPEGPVGEQSSVNGAGFISGTTINVVLAPGDATLDASLCLGSGVITIANNVLIQNDNTFSLNFTWPSDATQEGEYSVCALDPTSTIVISNQDGGPFTVLSPDAPVIQLSTTNLNLGDSVTISGSNFVPSQTVNVVIATCHNCDAAPIASTTVDSDTSGVFSVALTIPNNASPGTYVATAFTQNGLLDVGLIGGAISLTVNAPATATPNPTATATATNTPQAATPTARATTSSGGSTTGSNTIGSNTGGTDNTPYIIGIVLAVIVLLAALAVGAFLLIRRRGALGPTGVRRAPPPAREGGYGAYSTPGGYGGSISSPSGAYTPPSGSYTPPGGYTPITGTTGANTPPDWRVMPTWDGSQTAGLPGASGAPATPATPLPQAPPQQPNVPNPGDDAPTIPGSL